MNGEACIKKAYAFILTSDFEQAIIWFEQAIAAEPDNASYYHKCAISCARSGKWSKAYEHARKALELAEDEPEYIYHFQTIEARLQLSNAQLLLTQEPPALEEALLMLKQAVELDPLCFDAFYWIAMTYAELGQLDEAAVHAREAIRLDPGHSAARRLFADVSRRRRLMRYRINGQHRRRNR